MESNFYRFIFIPLFILAGEYRKTAFPPQNKPLILVKKDHSSLSAKLFCLQIHFFSHRRIWDIWMDIQSSDASPSSERLMFPLFLEPCAWKKQPRKKDHDAGNETRLPVARLSWQSAPLYLCSTLLPFHSLRYFTNHSAMAPEGENSWEQNVNSSTADKHAGRDLCCSASCPDMPTWCTSLLLFSETESCYCLVNNSTLSHLLRVTGLRNSCGCLQSVAWK